MKYKKGQLLIREANRLTCEMCIVTDADELLGIYTTEDVKGCPRFGLQSIIEECFVKPTREECDRFWARRWEHNRVTSEAV